MTTPKGHTPQTVMQGPWPFITYGSFVAGKKRTAWHSRQHRKGLDLWQGTAPASPQPFWHRPAYNWCIGAVFALGAFLFMLASLLSMAQTAEENIPSNLINIVFFAGSLPFTCAALMQLIQAANSADFPGNTQAARPKRFELVGWHPRHAGWLSSYTQFLGTLAFNMNTFNAILSPTKWDVKDAVIWLPDIVGSLLFLISGYLAFIEAGHRYWSWRLKDLSWQIVFINLMGCIAFMTAAILSYFPSVKGPGWIASLSNLHTLIGAFCFFVAALLTCRESKGRFHYGN